MEPESFSWGERERPSGPARLSRHGVAQGTDRRGETLRLPNLTRGTRVVASTSMTRLARGQESALVHVTPQTQTALAYVRGALFNPVSLSVMAFAVCVGVGYAGLLGALIALAAFVTLGASATRYRVVRQ